MREHFWRVRVQPGKPVLFGTLGDCHVLGLPGNPVSSFVSFHLFGVPAIQHWLGVPASPREKAILNRPVSNDGNRPHYLRGHFDPETRTFGSVGLQKSHGMLGLSKANAIARIPPMTQSDEGSEVEILRV
jgi:molybdopterin molybdotransferase